MSFDRPVSINTESNEKESFFTANALSKSNRMYIREPSTQPTAQCTQQLEGSLHNILKHIHINHAHIQMCHAKTKQSNANYFFGYRSFQAALILFSLKRTFLKHSGDIDLFDKTTKRWQWLLMVLAAAATTTSANVGLVWDFSSSPPNLLAMAQLFGLSVTSSKKEEIVKKKKKPEKKILQKELPIQREYVEDGGMLVIQHMRIIYTIHIPAMHILPFKPCINRRHHDHHYDHRDINAIFATSNENLCTSICASKHRIYFAPTRWHMRPGSYRIQRERSSQKFRA